MFADLDGYSGRPGRERERERERERCGHVGGMDAPLARQCLAGSDSAAGFFTISVVSYIYPPSQPAQLDGSF